MIFRACSLSISTEKSPMCRRCAFHCSNAVRSDGELVSPSVKTSVHGYINHSTSFIQTTKVSIHISLAQATSSAQDQEIQSVKSRCFKATHFIFQAPWSTATASLPLKPRFQKKETTQPTNKIKKMRTPRPHDRKKKHAATGLIIIIICILLYPHKTS